MEIALLIFLIVLGLLFWKCTNLKEGFAGALTQLYAKGPQDRYLIGNQADKYYYWYPYYETIWNNPTRLTNYYYYDPYYRRSPYRPYYYGHVYPFYYYY